MNFQTNFQAYSNDLIQLMEEVKATPSQYRKRNLLRGVSSYLEALSNLMVSLVLTLDEHRKFLSNEERYVAQNKQFIYDDKKGTVRVKSHNPRLGFKLRFGLNKLAKSIDKDFDNQISESFWQDLGKFLKVRNRIVHPIDSDPDLSENEYELVISFAERLPKLFATITVFAGVLNIDWVKQRSNKEFV